MREVILHPDALSEFIEAGLQYTDISISLGNAFYRNFESSIELIRKFPESCPLLEENVRKCVIIRFSYNILYEEFDSVIYIWAVAPQKKDPEYWRDRIIDLKVKIVKQWETES
jgi:hypothetical protein